MHIDDVKIDDEFKCLCPGLTDDELRRLKANIISDGEFREPVVVWKSEEILIDGHNRHDVWWNMDGEQRKQIAPPRVLLKEFASREEAHNWIISNQLGRRNLDEKQKSYLIGKRYQAEKKDKSKNLKPGGSSGNVSSGHSDHSKKTEVVIAEEVGKSPKQVRRDEKFTEAVDTLVENIGPEVKPEILNGKEITKKKVMEIAELPADNQKDEYDRAMGRGKPSGGDSFDPAEWGGMEPVDDPVIPEDVVTEYHVKEMQAAFNEVQKRATALKKAIHELPDGPGGAWYNPNAMQDIMTCYTNLMNTIKYRKPVAVCGHCGGKKCERCYQTGALNKDQSEALREGLEATA
ncbi:hypothetical protein [Gimesia algae]|uniref:ParB/Sulfiredoxin domain-containing protein n=1 Tax=Gimesia algae TaxID=2527971 RepID=A0A517VMI2_9PLAN|nr:hypothetical protein [Gimesia algae]QDT94185.1 hypothetical protein Pan161_58780 [Gimesia algae]